MKYIALGLGIWLSVLQSYGSEAGDALYRQGAAVYASNPVQACSFFVQAAEEGSVSAMVGAGHCYETGTGSTVDYTAALKWYEAAAKQNSIKGCEGLARIYASCDDPNYHDGTKAVRFASAIVRKKPRDADALAILAAAHARNIDFEKAVKIGLKTVRSAGSIDRAREMTARLERYKVGEPFPAKASDVWIFQASEANATWAVVKMAQMYNNKSSGMYDRRKALLMGQKAIELGDAQLYPMMGDLYYFEEDGLMDLKKAAEYYRLAAANRCYKGKIPTRVRYRHYFKYDAARCVRLAVTSAKGHEYTTRTDSGNYDAYGNPIFITNTVKIPPNPELAKFLYELAAKKGHIGAKARSASLGK